MRNFFKVLCIVCLLSMLPAATPIAAQDHTTPYWLLSFGNADYRGSGIPVGTKIRAYDPNGVLCGETVVTHLGTYGFLACYFDDPTTDKDEGIEPGDTVDFYFNGEHAGSVRVPDDVDLGQLFEVYLSVQACIDGYEPDDTMVNQEVITGPERHTLNSEKESWDQDWKKFEAKENWTYQIKARSSQPLSITQPVLRLYDASGILVAENDLDKWGRGAEIWWWNAGDDQDMYIQVTEANGFSGCRDYTLTMKPWSPEEMQTLFGE
ncbi:MAG: hypothetical protein R2932_41320 [Caldilineaceae bacterium]